MEETFAPGPAAMSDEWIKHLPMELRESFLNAKVRSQLNALDDDTPLTQDLASIYLDVSDATLKRMRASGKGPQYIQGSGEEGSVARNQKVLYTVGSLKDWISKNRTQSTGHAAIRRGLMFTSVQDISIQEPWWRGSSGSILGHVYSSQIKEHQQMGNTIVWLDLTAVAKENCKFKEALDMRALVVKVLQKEIEHIKARQENEHLQENLSNE